MKWRIPALLVCLAGSLLPGARLWAYEGGSLKNHAHSSASGDGGATLTPTTINAGTIFVSNLSVTNAFASTQSITVTSFTVQGNMQMGATTGNKIFLYNNGGSDSAFIDTDPSGALRIFTGSSVSASTRVVVGNQGATTFQGSSVTIQGAPFSVNSSSAIVGNVGTPAATMEVFDQNRATAQGPNRSGTDQINNMLRLRSGTGEALDFGFQNGSPFGLWMQHSDATNLATAGSFAINPNGGNVAISSNNPSATIDVGGAIRATSMTITTNGITFPNGTTLSSRYSVANSTTGQWAAEAYTSATFVRVTGSSITYTASGNSNLTQTLLITVTASVANSGLNNRCALQIAKDGSIITGTPTSVVKTAVAGDQSGGSFSYVDTGAGSGNHGYAVFVEGPDGGSCTFDSFGGNTIQITQIGQ